MEKRAEKRIIKCSFIYKRHLKAIICFRTIFHFERKSIRTILFIECCCILNRVALSIFASEKLFQPLMEWHLLYRWNSTPIILRELYPFNFLRKNLKFCGQIYCIACNILYSYLQLYQVYIRSEFYICVSNYYLLVYRVSQNYISIIVHNTLFIKSVYTN